MCICYRKDRKDRLALGWQRGCGNLPEDRRSETVQEVADALPLEEGGKVVI